MSQPFFRITHPFEILYRPTFKLQAKRAILRSAFAASAIADQHTQPGYGDAKRPVPSVDVSAALRVHVDLPSSEMRH